MTEEIVRDTDMKAKTQESAVAGETTIDDEVIAAVVGVVAREVESIASLGTSSVRRTLAERLGGVETRSRGVEVEAGKKEAIIDITVTVIYGFSIPKTVIELRRKVASHLLQMTGLVAKEINIRVVAIEFPERMPGRLQ